MELDVGVGVVGLLDAGGCGCGDEGARNCAMDWARDKGEVEVEVEVEFGWTWTRGLVKTLLHSESESEARFANSSRRVERYV